MATRLEQLLAYLGRPASRPNLESDAALLDRFVRHRDEAAFESLVHRHGPMVLGVCRRILHNAHDAEDVFQATFLTLARKAASIQPAGSLPVWLHAVARRLALKYRQTEGRRQYRETRSIQAAEVPPQPDPLDQLSVRELLHILDEELQRLPEVYRLPLILCCLEGHTQDEAARVLGWTLGSVKGRLQRGRVRLHAQLVRRGLTLGMGLLAVAGLQQGVAAAMPSGLIRATVRAALRFVVGGDSGIAAEVVALAEGEMKAILAAKMKMGMVLLGVTLVVVAGGVVARQILAPQATKLRQRADEPKAGAEMLVEPGAGGRATARVDCYGDPLPVHAVARMGTVRQWYGRLDCDILPSFLAFSRDGKTLVSREDNRFVCLWDAATGREIRRIITGPDNAIHEKTLLALSPDGRTLVTAKKRTVYLWEFATGKLLHKLTSRGPYRGAEFVEITFLPNGKILTLDQAGKGDNRIYLWDVATGGTEISRLSGQGKYLRVYGSQKVSFSQDGKMIAAVSDWVNVIENDGKISLWEVATGKKIRQLQLMRKNERFGVYSVAFSPDGKTLAAGGWGRTISSEGAICVWEVASGKLIHQFKAARTIGLWSYPLAYSPDGKKLVGGGDGHLWDVATGKEIRSFGWKNAQVAIFSPNGKILAAGDGAGVIRLWEVATGKEILPHKGHQRSVTSIAYSSNSKTLASRSNDETVRLWEVATGKEIRQLAKHTTWTRGSGSLAYSPDGKMLASIGNMVHLWDTATSKEICRFGRGGLFGLFVRDETFESVIFSPDSKFLATTEGSQTIRLWQVATGKQIYTLSRKRSSAAPFEPWSVAFSPDGQMLAVPGKDGTIDLWEAATGKSIGQLQLKQDDRRVLSLAFSPDGWILATTSSDWREDAEAFVRERTTLWEVATGKEICQLNEKNNKLMGPCRSLTFSPDGRMLATIETGREIYLWEVATGKHIGQLSGHRSDVRCAVFSPDGKTLASGSDDLTCLVWDVTLFRDQLKPMPTLPPDTRASLVKERLEAAWAGLAEEPAQAYAAVRTLWVMPAQAILLLRERIRPVAPVTDPKQLQRWIADLDDNSFPVREKAQREIEKLGELAGHALRQALKDRPALEARRRLQDLLAKLEPKRLRELRAVHVLEFLGTAEARQVLQAFAKGVPEASLTRDAQAALARLTKRSATKP